MAADTRVCALDGCDAPLTGKATSAQYCTRQHKVTATKRRRAAAAKEAAREAERAAFEAERQAAERAKARADLERRGLPPLPEDRPVNPTGTAEQIAAILLDLNREDRKRARALERAVEKSYRRKHPLASGTVI